MFRVFYILSLELRLKIMHMKPQIKKIAKKKTPNYEKAAIIQFELKKRGLTQRVLAKELGVSEQSVYGVVHGIVKSQKISELIYQKTGMRA